MNEFKVDIDTILASKLGFEAYFVLYCLYTKNEQLLLSYCNKCKKINTDIFKELENSGLINIKINDKDRIYYELLSLTDKGQSLLMVKTDSVVNLLDSTTIPEKSEHNFEDFRTYYPSSVKEGYNTRRLHGNLKKCRSLYEKLLLETTHDMLCKCASLYYEEKYNSNSLKYMQNLETWLNQKNYIQYLDDARQLKETTNKTIENTNLDAI